MIPLKKLTTEAYQADPEDGVVHFGANEVDFISVAAGASPRSRCRILCHPDKDAKLHSMLVAYKAGTYIRPNRHRGKDESVTVLVGRCVVVFFNNQGKVTQSVQLGIDVYFCRIPVGMWHTLVLETDAVLLESTPGPFDPADTEYAPWVPAEREGFEPKVFLRDVQEVKDWRYPHFKEEKPNVFVPEEPVVWFGEKECFLLESRTSGGDRSRALAHPSEQDRLQEMLLWFDGETPVRPSRHAEDETLYVLEGTGTYCFFDDHGSMTKQVPLGPLGSGKSCFCRVPAGRWHTLLLDGPMLVLEAAPGPFVKADTEYAPWEAKK